uniref:Uncharacterized protein n=1 Tax=Cajanus cajan TaxID=3821 RepID=A0A151QZI0_CAJCA|nr:hypothetical protein KK1_043182 [Cajanus cajan]
MPGLDSSIVEHHLPLNPECTPIKKKLRRMKPEVSLKIKEEVKKQFDVGSAVAKYPQWVSNIVPVPKKDGKVRMCLIIHVIILNDLTWLWKSLYVIMEYAICVWFGKLIELRGVRLSYGLDLLVRSGYNLFSRGVLILTNMDGEDLLNPINSDAVKKYYA